MEEIIRQMKYDIQNIESKVQAVKKAKEKMPNYVGKPIYDGFKESIIKLKKELEESKKVKVVEITIDDVKKMNYWELLKWKRS